MNDDDHTNIRCDGSAAKLTNGHAKHVDTEAELKVIPCCVRLGHMSWCFKPDGHTGDHEGTDPSYDVVEEKPALWRNDKGKQK